MKPRDLDDSELVQRLREGSEDAFRRIYERYGTKLFYFARSLNVQVEDAQEIVQETFIKLWEYRHQADPALSLNAYLFTIARNLIYNQVKKWAVRQRYLAGMLQGEVPTGNIQDRELHVLIDQAMAEMPDKQRAVFRMSRFEGVPNQQIADELGISKSTVENHINKALKYLRRRLEQCGYEITTLWILFWGAH